MYGNCLLICFNSVFFTNQVTNVWTEVVPFCKSGHVLYNQQRHCCCTQKIAQIKKYLSNMCIIVMM